ncbi:hypothetical protein GCM10017673_39140 [Streptosporangium violaceochromogenes]|nr:hypothetical protein GCM10017673_39140 [Streptosporangium violaceochromogenes]
MTLPLPPDLGFQKLSSGQDGTTVWYDGPARLHRTGHDSDPQNVAAKLIVVGEPADHDCGRCLTRLVCCRVLWAPRQIIRVSPDPHREPLRPEDLRYPFVDEDGRTPRGEPLLRQGEWTVVFPRAAVIGGPPPRATAFRGEGTVTPGRESWVEWSNDLTVDTWGFTVPALRS